MIYFFSSAIPVRHPFFLVNVHLLNFSLTVIAVYIFLRQIQIVNWLRKQRNMPSVGYDIATVALFTMHSFIQFGTIYLR